MKIFALIIWACFCTPLWATSMVPLDMDTLVNESDAVALVRVLESETFYRQGHVWSRFHFTVEEYLSGSGAHYLNVVQPGGSKDQFKTLVAGVRDLEPGKLYCLFLWLDGTGNYQIMGYSQGSFETYKDSDGELKLKQGPHNAIFSTSTVQKNLMTVSVDGKHLAWRRFMQDGNYERFKELVQLYAK